MLQQQDGTVFSDKQNPPEGVVSVAVVFRAQIEEYSPQYKVVQSMEEPKRFQLQQVKDQSNRLLGYRLPTTRGATE